ncbi:MAG: hypothetical protein PHO27_12100 [Sulfuricurvum sp.]|jgi:hypothetical protein|nr:hypothetical protein [Sulfuricurvum sp.]
MGRCFLCPADEWREITIKTWSDAPCEDYIYGDWIQGDEKTRKKYAAQIAAMKWSYLPEYEDIDVSDLLEGIK